MERKVVEYFRTDGQKVSIDLTQVQHARRRISEIAALTVGKAPELLAFLSDAAGILAQETARCAAEQALAKRLLARRRSLVLLDMCADILQKKGLTRPGSPAGSEDMREAVITSDPDYQKLEDQLGAIEAMRSYLEAEFRTVETAVHTIRILLKHGQTFTPHTSTGGVPEDSTIAEIDDIMNDYHKRLG